MRIMGAFIYISTQLFGSRVLFARAAFQTRLRLVYVYVSCSFMYIGRQPAMLLAHQSCLLRFLKEATPSPSAIISQWQDIDENDMLINCSVLSAAMLLAAIYVLVYVYAMVSPIVLRNDNNE